MHSTIARFPPRLQQAIADRLGWSSLRPVQELAGQAILDGKNAIVLAPTAGGKTEAAIFPLLANLIELEPHGVGILYIAPIKALLNNQCDRFATYTEMVGLRSFVWHGDIKGKDKQSFLKEPADVLLTTPESLEVMLLSAKVPHARLFGDLRAVIIDEIHALAGSDRGTHLLSVLERLITAANNQILESAAPMHHPKYQARDVQRVGLSATVGNPEQILNWMQGSSQRQSIVIDPPKIPAKREIAILQRDEIGAKLSVIRAYSFVKVERLRKMSRNECAIAAQMYLCIIVLSLALNAKLPKRTFKRERMLAFSAPVPSN